MPNLPLNSSAIEKDDLSFNNTPNQLTLFRIFIVPAVIFCLSRREPLWDYLATALFSIASITDFFDGYLARKYKIETVYGKLMDPLADKFLVICSLIALQDLGRIHPVIVMLLVCRELTITGLRALASAEGVVMGASSGGKWKTAIQMVAIPMLMCGDVWIFPFKIIGYALLYISLAFSLWSAKDYVVEFFKGLKKSRTIKKSLKIQLKAERKRIKEERRETRRAAKRDRRSTQI